MTERLPVAGSDTSTWGPILSGFLLVAHNADGTLKSTEGGTVTTPSIPASGSTQTNTTGRDVTVYLTAGAAGVAIDVAGIRTLTLAPFQPGSFRLPAGSTYALTSVPVDRGIHMNGPEFGLGGSVSAASLAFSNLNPGTIDSQYHYDSQGTYSFLAGRGFKRVKLPVRWERLQPTLNAAFNSAELTRLTTALDRINTAGMKAILDIHNYGLYFKEGTPTAQPVLVASGSGSNLVAGTYTIGYTHWNGSDSGIGPTQTVSVTAGQNIVMTANNVPRSASSVNFWMISAPATVTTGYLSGAGISGGTASFTLTNKTLGNGSSPPAAGTGVGLGNSLGDPLLPISAFSDLWTRLSTAFKNHAAILNGGAYCIMTEPQNSGGLTKEIWQAASQAAVTAIRAVDTATPIHVCGFNWANMRGWAGFNGPAAWIADPYNNVLYESHSYWDDQAGGQYSATYAAEVSNAGTAGFTAGINADALTSRVRADVKAWQDWLVVNNARGVVGEVGWPNIPSGEQAAWNALAQVFLSDCDYYNLETVAWQCGEWAIDKLTIYSAVNQTGPPLSISNAQAATVEAHPTLYRLPIKMQWVP